METLKQALEELSVTYKDTPENEERQLISFVRMLLQLPMKKRRQLLPAIQELQWIKSRHSSSTSMTSCGRDRARFLAAVQFVCAGKREMNMTYDIDFDLLCKLLPLYCPAWFTDFINETNFNLDYHELIRLTEMGYLKELAPNRIARVLPGSIRLTSADRKGNDSFDSSRLLTYPVTLQEHIWTLFEYDSPVSYYDLCAKNAYKKGITPQDESIGTALYRFSTDEHLDRNRLLRATLATFHRGFKMGMAGWFAELFETLRPTVEELLSLQEEMMQVFTSPYTRPVNVMLQQFRKIATETEFRYQAFVEQAATLLFSSTKNSLTIICAIFEEIAAQHPETRETCCIALCQLFLKKDESLQKRVADFITKYGDASSPTLQETLQTYRTEMLQSVQAIIVPSHIPSADKADNLEAAHAETPHTAPARICREDNRILFPADKEEFLFQLNHLFDMEESWETDTTIAAIIAFHPQLDEDDFSRMEPLFQRAADIMVNHWETYKRLLATFILEYQHLCTHKVSTRSGILRKLFTRLEDSLLKADASRGTYAGRTFKRLADWTPGHSNATCFIPIQKLWTGILRSVRRGSTLPLLSTPTHAPAYIEATTLVKRLASYQEAEQTPCPWDFQLAIARCAMEDKAAAATAARQALKGEYLHLLLFLLDEDVQPEPPYRHQPAWISAGLVKNPATEFPAFRTFACNTLPHNYLSGDYELIGLQPNEPPYGADKRLLQLDFNKWHEYAERNSHQLWQEHLVINSKYNIGDSHYMEPLLCCYPNRPEPLIAQIILHYLSFATPQEESKRCITHALCRLLSFHGTLRETSLLLLSGSLLFADKTVRSYAAELWVEGLTAGRIDNRRVGELLARLVCMRLAPIKRFIDIVYESMYQRSSFHNRQLEELLTVFISGLPVNPVTGIKQLLELHLELLANNRSQVTDDFLRQRLTEWAAAHNNLKKVATALNDL